MSDFPFEGFPGIEYVVRRSHERGLIEQREVGCSAFLFVVFVWMCLTSMVVDGRLVVECFRTAGTLVKDLYMSTHDVTKDILGLDSGIYILALGLLDLGAKPAFGH